MEISYSSISDAVREGLYWNKRVRQTHDAWGRLHVDPKNPSKAKPKWITLDAKRNFWADVDTYIQEQGVPAKVSQMIMERASSVQIEVLDTDVDGYIGVLDVVDEFVTFYKLVR